MFLEYIKRINNGLNIIPENDGVAILFLSMIPELLGNFSIELGLDAGGLGDAVHGFVDFVLLELGGLGIAEGFEGRDELAVLVWRHDWLFKFYYLISNLLRRVFKFLLRCIFFDAIVVLLISKKNIYLKQIHFYFIKFFIWLANYIISKSSSLMFFDLCPSSISSKL